MRCTSVGLVTSTPIDSAAAPRVRISSAVRVAESASRSAASTQAPSAANANADAQPMPEPAPVITLTSPCRRATVQSVFFQSGEDLVGMALDLHVGKDGLDGAVFPDHKSRSSNPHVLT